MKNETYIGSYIPNDAHRALKIKAATNGDSIASLVRKMVLAAVKRTPRKTSSS